MKMPHSNKFKIEIDIEIKGDEILTTTKYLNHSVSAKTGTVSEQSEYENLQTALTMAENDFFDIYDLIIEEL
jgi:hypothetical protein